MPKRAVLIVTDFERIVYDDANMAGGVGLGPWEADASEQLLADLRTVLRYADHGARGVTGGPPEAIERVRAALPTAGGKRG
jgi:hypothetical protein